MQLATDARLAPMHIGAIPGWPGGLVMFVTGPADGSTGLVIVMNHVLADGTAGPTVLAQLVDEGPGLACPEPINRAADPRPRSRS